MTDTKSLSLNETPRSNRLHIGIYGRRNNGKSSLINAITNQGTAIVSPVAGTTADPVYKSMEVYGLGPCVLIDTAGFDDEGPLGALRVEKTREALKKTDIAILVLSPDATDLSLEKSWLAEFKENNVPVLAVLNKSDLIDEQKLEKWLVEAEKSLGLTPISVSALDLEGIEPIREHLLRRLPEDYEMETITGHLVNPGDTVLLVMPQDIQAPKGRLILPQVQTLRDLLDHKCIVTSVTTDQLDNALAAMKSPPKLIITDSQVFPQVYKSKPAESILTSFSVLFARYKGDDSIFRQGAEAADQLTENSRILIAEACTHAPLSEDIGREKIPNLLRKKVGQGLQVDIAAGSSFPKNLEGYDLIVHCGACMFNRKYVLSRIHQAQNQGVPITNYGMLLAKLTGILDLIP